MNLVIENSAFRLEINEKCIPVSLICKETGEECLVENNKTALFSLTEPRPYNNEIKLAHPNKRTTFQANRVRLEGDKLIVGFELVLFEAVVSFTVKDRYVSFTLEDFIVTPEAFPEYLKMSPPPVCEFRLIQLAVKNRKNFGKWLNVMWDEKAGVNVLANSPWPRIDHEERDGYTILYADALSDVRLKGTSATLIAAPGGKILDAVEDVEIDYDLPRGVQSRKNEHINQSAYWVTGINLSNVDEHIKYAKRGGFRLMLIYYTAIVNESGAYNYCGDYDFRDTYPEKEKSLREMLQKIKAAGITPGIHFLQTHIGTKSRYVTPKVDPRLNLTRHFTLARPLGKDDDTVYVFENPHGTVMHPSCRVLNFGGEAIHYESYTTEPPYAFTGCKRGHYDTDIITHPYGEIGGILDVSEFGAGSIYAGQNSDLQDEVGAKIANLYNQGFEFVYCDGSEGAPIPHEIYIPLAQYRVYKLLGNAPHFCEAAAKSHFSWHMLSGGNAFDIFPMREFKEKLAEHPLREAPQIAQDFTRLNFGWWSYNIDTLPDIYEYGTSHAAAFDCPVSIQFGISTSQKFDENPRSEDNFEVLRRWEDAREMKILTSEQKEMMKDKDREFILLIDENGKYELQEYFRLKLRDDIDSLVTAYVLDRADGAYVVVNHNTGTARLALDLDADATYTSCLGKNDAGVEKLDGKTVIEIAGRRYFKADCTRDELIKAFENAKIID